MTDESRGKVAARAGARRLRVLLRWVNRPTTTGQLTRYVLVGGCSAAVETALFLSLHLAFGWTILRANVTAVLTVLLFGFAAQKVFTFARKGHTFVQAPLFAFMVGSGFVINNLLVYLFGVLLMLPPLAAKVLQLTISFGINFSWSKFVVFRAR